MRRGANAASDIVDEGAEMIITLANRDKFGHSIRDPRMLVQNTRGISDTSRSSATQDDAHVALTHNGIHLNVLFIYLSAYASDFNSYSGQHYPESTPKNPQ